MKRYAIMMASVLLMGLVVPLMAENGVSLRVKSEVVNIRAKAEISAEILTRVNAGTILESLGKSGNWYKVEVEVDGRALLGYVHSSVVEVISDEDLDEAPPIRSQNRDRSNPRVTRAEPARSPRLSESYFNGIQLLGGLSLGGISHSETDTGELEEADYQKRRSGLIGGVSFDMGSQIGLEIGFNYIQKGVKYTGSIEEQGMAVTGDAVVKMDVISAPVLVKIRFSPGSTPFIVAGGEVGYILSSKVDWSWTDPETQQVEKGTEDIKEYTNSLDYGLIFGAGYEMSLGGGALVIQGRYHLGMANVMKNEETDGGEGLVEEESWVKTNAIVLLVGFKF